MHSHKGGCPSILVLHFVVAGHAAVNGTLHNSTLVPSRSSGYDQASRSSSPFFESTSFALPGGSLSQGRSSIALPASATPTSSILTSRMALSENSSLLLGTTSTYNDTTGIATAPGSPWTVPAQGSGSSYYTACNKEWQLFYDGHVRYTRELTSSWWVTNYTATITTLCDGHSRVLGTVTPVTTFLSVTTSEGIPPPSCSVQQSDCASAISQYSSAEAVWYALHASWSSAGAHLADEPSPNTVSVPVCRTTTPSSTGPQPVSASTPAGSCGPCTIVGGAVQLLYFPVTTSYTRDMCATAPYHSTFCPFGSVSSESIPSNGYEGTPCPYFASNRTSTHPSGPYTISASTTFYENRAYLSYETAYATDSCGLVGNTHGSGILEMASSDVYGVSGYHYFLEQVAYSFNFADLIPPIPASAYYCMPQCWESGDNYTFDGTTYGAPNNINGEAWHGDFCTLMVDAEYHPYLAVPPEFRYLDPAWSECLLALNGVFDPVSLLHSYVGTVASTHGTLSCSPKCCSRLPPWPCLLHPLWQGRLQARQYLRNSLLRRRRRIPHSSRRHQRLRLAPLSSSLFPLAHLDKPCLLTAATLPMQVLHRPMEGIATATEGKKH
ncbi:hypothetical protein BAUCODRAFT_430818 [Baudoinia panamericana UAMH 10762]|uniref:Uncharacterized protein n=1 Tax=Baudoinia panamericana (strain UAMH 10762) TaxID=717646 RepID=M2LVB8_BAUPA|nr:uncharacterized protein BAUCODRAFT_430818 [Baudoinia panamericana UAMH 10762]EMC98562.1 hypothetical protein BAUCODRAFT_430818 [Baudoinia panamericana UAMH 10762]